MNRNHFLLRVGIVVGLIAVLAAIVMLRPAVSKQSGQGSETWTCSMHPQIRLPSPGTCPICGMKLIPVSELPSAKDDLEKRAGIETEEIERRELFKEIRTVGKLDYSERQVELITARIAGRVDRLFVDFTGIEVKQNDHLVNIYSPELYAAQAELIRSLEAFGQRGQGNDRTFDRFAESNLEAAREKLRLWGLKPDQIAEIERTRKEQTHVTIYSPLQGTVVEKSVRTGQYVKEGDALYRIANLDPIWLYLNIYEFDVAWVRFGQPVEVTVEAYKGETFAGTITFIDPFLDDATRTIRARVNLKNSDHRLKPMMYAQATIRVPLRADGSPEPTGMEGKYICPMHPEVTQEEPGRCSICDMQLEQVPKQKGMPAPGTTLTDKAPGTINNPSAADSQSMTNGKNTAASSAMKHDMTGMPDWNDQAELAIPVSAVLDTGRRQICYRLTDAGAYELVEIKLGSRAQAVDENGKRRDYYLVLGGLEEGDRVVTQSGFLLDSQRQIEGMPSLLYPRGQAASMSGHAGHASAPSSQNSSSATPGASQHPAGHQH